MIRSWISRGVAAVALAWAATAGAAVFTQPDFVRRPKGEELAESYPKAALALGIEGWASFACSVSAKGELVGCHVVEEAPTNLGFGKAALSLVPMFQMRPMTRDGMPIDGGHITIPIAFRLPKDDPPAGSPFPTTPQALAKGRELAEVMRLPGRIEAVAEQKALEAEADDGPPPASRFAAARALRKAAAAHADDSRDAYARALASVLSEEEMSDLIAFQHSVGHAIAEHPELTASQLKIDHAVGNELRSISHAQFCAKHPCPSAADLGRVLRKVEQRHGRIDDPMWSASPSELQISDAAPPLAAQLGLSAAARMTCVVEGDGRLRDCRVDEEIPERMGFGSAALELSSAYQLDRKQLILSEGRNRVMVRISFKAPEAGAVPLPAPLPKSAESLDAARELVDSMEVFRRSRADLDRSIAGLESEPPAGADMKVFQDEIDTYRASAEKAVASVRELEAALWASALDPDQLIAVRKFYKSAGYHALTGREQALELAATRAFARAASMIQDDARREYCRTEDCSFHRSPINPQSSPNAAPSTRRP